MSPSLLNHLSRFSLDELLEKMEVKHFPLEIPSRFSSDTGNRTSALQDAMTLDSTRGLSFRHVGQRAPKTTRVEWSQKEEKANIFTNMNHPDG